ncbi:MAG: thiamine diphosphokinase [Ignavibacteria bacterium]|nr:thiamine diphosphokinase [Ignavibacteria bacterium]
MREQRIILFLNGELPPLRVINKFCLTGSYIICADGGANGLTGTKIVPNIILGDLDSLKPAARRYFSRKKVEIRRIQDQETTDFEKALLYCIEMNLNNITVFGAVSSRPDHTINNFSVLKRYSKILDIRVIDKVFEMYYVNKKTSFAYRKGYTVSLMPMPSAGGITTKGLKYKLRNESLELGTREGTLNVSTANNISIEFKKGSLLLFKKHFI